MRLLRLIGKTRKVRSSRVAVRWLFLRALGAVYLIAFTSLRVQVLGLYGSRGIQPIRELLAALRAQEGRRAYRLAPSLLWLGSSDRDLVRLCRAGQVCSLASADRCGAWPDERRRLGAVSVVCHRRARFPFIPVGRAAARDGTARDARHHARGRGAARGPVSRPGLVASSCAGSPFAFISSPASSRFDRGTRPGGAVQPAPITTRRSRCRRGSAGTRTTCRGPFTGFRPRRRSPSSSARRSWCSRRDRLRKLGFAALAGLQALIAATGNYGFFNVLSVALAAWALDDDSFPRPASAGPPRPPPAGPAARRAGSRPRADCLRRALHAARRRVDGDVRRSSPAPPAADAPHGPGPAHRSLSLRERVRPLRRHDDRAAGDRDRRIRTTASTWREYCSATSRRGPRTRRARLRPTSRAWTGRCGSRRSGAHRRPGSWRSWRACSKASPEVLKLLGANPFPDRPPRYVRALLYEYRMTDLETKRRTGAWWQRELIDTYFPPATAPVHRSGFRSRLYSRRG